MLRLINPQEVDLCWWAHRSGLVDEVQYDGLVRPTSADMQMWLKDPRDKSQSGLTPASNGATFLHGGFADALPYLQAVVYLKRHEKHR